MEQRKHQFKEILSESLDSIAVEMRELQGFMEEFAEKYGELNLELNRAKAENARLTRENELLRSSGRALMAGFGTRSSTEEPPPAPEEVN